MDTASNPPDIAPWALGLNASSKAVDRVKEWWELAHRAYPANTLRAWRFDWTVFMTFCEPQRAPPLPASAELVAAFVEQQGRAGKKPATVRRYLSTIALAHRVAKLPNPCDEEPVRLAVRTLLKAQGTRQRQARPLGWQEINRFLETAGESLPATRERALLTVAYDSMARRSELVALEVRDLEFLPDGTGRALIQRSKTDQVGEGASAYLSRTTVRHLKKWLNRAEIAEGAVFRRVIGRGTAEDLPEGRGRVGERLSVDGVAQAFKRVARWIGFTQEEVAAVSGHSIRVGATQDLLALNIDLVSVMQAGRWKTHRMPMRYGEHVLAARGGMARAATLQGRETS
jgi:site-specific recombinase XerD